MKPSPRLIQLVGALSGAQLTTAQYNGVSYVVCPVVAMVGNAVVWPVNSDSPVYVPLDVLSIAVEQWNNRPVVMNHPQVNGEYVSANSPTVLEQWAYGHTFNARIDEGKLKLDAYLDPARAKNVGTDAVDVLSRLADGEIVEISIGAFIVTEDSPGVTATGQEYAMSWVYCASDHLATLSTGLRGACSVEMGCGALRVNMGNDGQLTLAAALTQARTPRYTGTSTENWSAPSIADYVKYLHPGVDGPSTVAKMSTSLKAGIAAHSLLGNPSATNFRDLTLFAVVHPSNGKLYEKALRAVLGGRGTNTNVDDAALESARDMARRLLNSEFGIADLTAHEPTNEDDSDMRDTNKGLFARLLKGLSSLPGLIKPHISNNLLRNKLWDAIKDVEPGLYWLEDYDADAKTVVYTTRIMYGYEYDAPVEMHCWQRSFTMGEGDVVTVNNDAVEVEFVGTYKPLTEPADELAVTEANLNAATKPSCTCHDKKDNSPSSIITTQEGVATMKLTPAQRTELITKLTANAACKFDAKTLEAFTCEQLESLVSAYEVKPATVTANKGAAPIDPENLGTIIDPPDSTISAPNLTEAEWMAKAPATIRTLVETTQRREQLHRDDLVTKLKACSAFTEEKLKTFDTDTLETLAKTLNVETPASASALIADYSTRGVSVLPETPTTAKLPDTWGLSALASKQQAN